MATTDLSGAIYDLVDREYPQFGEGLREELHDLVMQAVYEVLEDGGRDLLSLMNDIGGSW
jgi:hypothetical protein